MPKRKGFLYEWMCDKEHIREAIVFGAKDKHDRRDVRRVLADVDGYTDRVYDLLQTQTFAPAQPKKRKIFDNSSRKWREIEYVPFFPDGIVHTLIFSLQGVFVTRILRLGNGIVYDKYLGDILRKRHLRRIIRLDTYIINRATSGQQTRYAYKKNASHLHLFKRGRFTPPHYVKSLTALK